jgi:sterol desaturase/sphingolipid hydroxylase (fatty acid hydroxylase superfamily)
VGLSPLVVAVYMSLNLSTQLFAHANIVLPTWLATALGRLVVTPVMHRVHHSRCSNDIMANYGLVFSMWDRLFGTYRSEPARGVDRIEFGVDLFREKYYQRLDRMLWLPLLVRQID